MGLEPGLPRPLRYRQDRISAGANKTSMVRGASQGVKQACRADPLGSQDVIWLSRQSIGPGSPMKYSIVMLVLAFLMPRLTGLLQRAVTGTLYALSRRLAIWVSTALLWVVLHCADRHRALRSLV
jgi:hypothetical protein